MALFNEMMDEAVDKDHEIAHLRDALIRVGRAAGAFLDDRVTTDFLMDIPLEVELKIAHLQAEDEYTARLRKALEAAKGYLLNAKIDLQTEVPKRTAIMTIDGGLVMVDAALKE